MTVIKQYPNKITIRLSKTEALYYFGYTGGIDAKTRNVKKIAERIVKNACFEMSKPNDSRLFTKICPLSTGEIEINTRMIKNRRLKVCRTVAFNFSKLSSLQFAEKIISSDKKILSAKSNLYLLDNKYFLTVSGNGLENRLDVITEFCDNVYTDKLKIEYIKEYGILLIKDNAVKRYYEMFVK